MNAFDLFAIWLLTVAATLMGVFIGQSGRRIEKETLIRTVPVDGTERKVIQQTPRADTNNKQIAILHRPDQGDIEKKKEPKRWKETVTAMEDTLANIPELNN